MTPSASLPRHALINSVMPHPRSADQLNSKLCWPMTFILWCFSWSRRYLIDSSRFVNPVDWWCSYPLQKPPRGYRFLKPGCFSKIRFADLDFKIISASSREYLLGMFTWKWTWLPPKPNSPNSKPNCSHSLKESRHVSMCACFLKHIYLLWVTNIMVTQLFRVSPEIFLELTLVVFFKIFTFLLHPCWAHPCGVPRATEKNISSVLKSDMASHLRDFRFTSVHAVFSAVIYKSKNIFF